MKHRTIPYLNIEVLNIELTISETKPCSFFSAAILHYLHKDLLRTILHRVQAIKWFRVVVYLVVVGGEVTYFFGFYQLCKTFESFISILE